MYSKLAALFKEMPVVTVLRYIKPDEVVAVGRALYRAGIRIIEVPLNSPDPFISIDKLKQTFAEQVVVGAGTVLSVDQVDHLAEIGGEIAVAPNTDTKVIRQAIAKKLVPIPGFATTTEAFTAYGADAKYLKLFPAATYGASYIKALKAVLPVAIKLIAVGGVGAKNAMEMLRAGAHGVGTGTEVYRPGDSAETVYKKAVEIVNIVRESR